MKTINSGSRMAYIDSLFPYSDEKRLSAVLYGASIENGDDYCTTIKLNLEDEEVKKNALIALYNLVGREILDEVANGQNFSDDLKMEAVSMISEYEDNDE